MKKMKKINSSQGEENHSSNAEDNDNEQKNMKMKIKMEDTIKKLTIIQKKLEKLKKKELKFLILKKKMKFNLQI